MTEVRSPAVSVCIANYNGEGMLVDCIESVLRQHASIAVEIIVHDDASTDASVDLIRRRYPEVVLIESAENVGFCRANNRMVERARGEFVLLLNNDAALFDDALETLLGLARSQQKPTILSLPQYDWETGCLVDRGCRLDLTYFPVPITDRTPAEAAYVIGACLWLPRSLWIELGGFPEWMESIGEDLYLCAIARLRGAHILVPDASGYRHRQGASFGGNRAEAGYLTTTVRRRYLSERNRTFALAILTPGLVMWPWLILHVALLVLEGATIALLCRKAAIFTAIYGRAVAGLLQRFECLLRLRTDVQGTRAVSLRWYLGVFVPRIRKAELLFRAGMPRING